MNERPPENDAGLAGLSVLVVDDEPDVCLGMERLVASTGARVRTAARGDLAIRRLDEDPADLVISDIRMPGMRGDELLAAIKMRRPATAVVLVTGFGTIEQAVECMRLGAEHFIAKPFDNVEFLRCVRAIGGRLLALRNTAAGGALGDAIVAGPGPMRAVLDDLPRIAATRLPILIQGETGTGKELVARAIHKASGLGNRPFLAVNCAALPDTLLESELFGHRRGAFTGAERDRDGLFVMARGGTVFLDEVTSMSPAFQAKLLRVVQQKVVRPLAAEQDVAVDFRLISAANRDLGEMAAKREFRDDLLYRLRVLEVRLPPLRERRDDIVLLARAFLVRSGTQCGIGAGATRFDPAAESALRAYDWPGNVRELENVLLRALVSSRDGVVRADDLGLPDPGHAVGSSYDDAKRAAIRRFQRRFVADVLRRENGNISHAAEVCGLTRAALQRILKDLES